ncbi:metal ABC transporter substrate-binding protein [Heyndrickxia sp. NPDC080065]|uniref:metal ABC transporter substrate-binding protein n=1 Tax=Heyndrickxia sp. NPDC080065 TaxID=3390568 RepID=UPI003CFFF017
MKRFRFKSILILFTAIILMAGCGKKEETSVANSSKDPASNKIKVITTFYPMYEFTKNVAGDRADVQLLIPSTIEPHDWEPSPKDMANIQSANIFIYNSEYMETWVLNVQKSIKSDKLSFVEASKGITLAEGGDEDHHDGEEGHDEHDHHHEMDPHVWLSPVLAQKEVESITAALIKADPNNKEAYEKNSDAYIAKLKQLDNDFREGLKNIKKKEMITQHAAFGYLAKEYGLKQVPIAGLSPDQEPSPAKLGELKKFAKQHDVKVIYFEELASPKVAQTLANEIGAKTQVLNTLEGLSKEDQDKGLDYIKVMENNLEILKQSQSK